MANVDATDGQREETRRRAARNGATSRSEWRYSQYDLSKCL